MNCRNSRILNLQNEHEGPQEVQTVEEAEEVQESDYDAAEQQEYEMSIKDYRKFKRGGSRTPRTADNNVWQLQGPHKMMKALHEPLVRQDLKSTSHMIKNCRNRE